MALSWQLCMVCTVYWLFLFYCYLLGDISPTTRVETSFDVGGDHGIVEKNGPEKALKEEAIAISDATNEKVKLTIVQFTEEDPILKWFLRIMSVMLLVCLLFLWIYYR